MKLRLFVCLGALTLLPLAAHAEDGRPPAPAHAPTPAATAPALPPTPPGHPPLNANGLPEQRPTAPDRLDSAADLKTGSIDALILDADERPVPGIDVRLGIMFNKIAEGESRSERIAKAGADGVAHFTGLENGSSYSYRVTVKNGAAEFASTPFPLKESGGMRATVHIFQPNDDLATAMVGMRGFFYIETRDDVFQIEGLFRVINLGRNAWIPRDVNIGLPAGFKAFSGGESMFDSRFEPVEGRGTRLMGTFPPGQRDLSFRFNVPKEANSTATFHFSPPPRSAEIRVIAVASPNMGLEVDGFEPPQDGIGPSGDRVLVTRKTGGRGQPEVQPFTVTLSGLPVPGPGRWVAVCIALGLAGVGVAGASGKLRGGSSTRLESDRARACDLLLDELVALTHAKERGEIGPQTHERTERALLDALGRIGLPSEAKPRKRAPKAARA